jgi:hypothetical protein
MGVEVEMLDFIQHFLPLLNLSFESTHPAFQVDLVATDS